MVIVIVTIIIVVIDNDSVPLLNSLKRVTVTWCFKSTFVKEELHPEILTPHKRVCICVCDMSVCCYFLSQST
jgi:hypothetical protein